MPNQLNALISLRLTKRERETWHRKAAAAGLSLSDYIREIVNKDLNGNR